MHMGNILLRFTNNTTNLKDHTRVQIKTGFRPYTSDKDPVIGEARNCSKENNDPNRPVWRAQKRKFKYIHKGLFYYLHLYFSLFINFPHTKIS